MNIIKKIFDPRNILNKENKALQYLTAFIYTVIIFVLIIFFGAGEKVDIDAERMKLAELDCSDASVWRIRGEEIAKYIVYINDVESSMDDNKRKLTKGVMTCKWGEDYVYKGGSIRYSSFLTKLSNGVPFAFPKMEEMQDCWCKGWYDGVVESFN
tara:strand:+ start:136 stop:600 length:465 start_codon:yes stop_codon:yes gene_type:complete